MPPLRRTADSPGLARLLADAPRERRVALAAFWQTGSPDQPGFVAALYRTMTDRDQVGRALERCSEIERRLFASLLAAADGRTPVELASRLPFSDSAIQDGLESLQERGLAWKVAAPGRGMDPDALRWAVPRDIASNFGPDWRATRTAPGDTVGALASHASVSALPVDRLTGEMDALPSAGAVRRELMVIVDGTVRRDPTFSMPPRTENAAWPWGVGLGILVQKGRSIAPGPRSQSWKGLSQRDQARALARLWLVNPAVSTDVPLAARSAVAAALVDLDDGVWYGFDSFARVVASRFAERPGRNPPIDSPERPLSSGRSLRRTELERAIAALRAIGIVDLASDERRRPVAIRLSSDGKYAFA